MLGVFGTWDTAAGFVGPNWQILKSYEVLAACTSTHLQRLAASLTIMLLPTRKIESKADLETVYDEYVRLIREGVSLSTVQVREFTLLMALLHTLAGSALDVVALTATSEPAQEAVMSAFIRTTARKVAAALGFEMKNTR